MFLGLKIWGLNYWDGATGDVQCEFWGMPIPRDRNVQGRRHFQWPSCSHISGWVDDFLRKRCVPLHGGTKHGLKATCWDLLSTIANVVVPCSEKMMFSFDRIFSTTWFAKDSNNSLSAVLWKGLRANWTGWNLAHEVIGWRRSYHLEVYKKNPFWEAAGSVTLFHLHSRI